MRFRTEPLSPSNAPEFDPSAYPRTYRIKRVWMIVCLLLGAFCTGGGTWGIWYFASGHEVHSAGEAAVYAGISFLMGLLGAGLLISSLRTNVVLSADAIEVRELLWPRRLRREEVAGRRLVRRPNLPASVTLFPRRRDEKKLKIPEFIETDLAFEAWLATVPDLDAEERRKSEEAAEIELGVAPEQLSERLAHARRVVKGLHVAALAALVWGVFYPRPYAAAMAASALLPLIAMALVARSRGLYSVGGLPNDVRPTLAGLVLGPGLVLAFRALVDIRVVHWQQVLAPVLLGGMAITFVLFRLDRRFFGRRAAVLVYLLFMSVYASGVVLEANALLDRSSPEVFQVAVLSKSTLPGEYRTWFLHLASWGPYHEPRDVMVPHSLYAAVNHGDVVCVLLWPGRLGIAWYGVTGCRWR